MEEAPQTASKEGKWDWRKRESVPQSLLVAHLLCHSSPLMYVPSKEEALLDWWMVRWEGEKREAQGENAAAFCRPLFGLFY